MYGKPFSELIGKIIKKVAIDNSKVWLRFTDNEDKIYYYFAEGDCCSNSWIEHISHISDLLDQKILDIEVIQTSEVIGTKQECDKIYGVKFKTADIYARFAIELRNSSNGYYGGDFTFAGNGLDDKKASYFIADTEESPIFSELKEDF